MAWTYPACTRRPGSLQWTTAVMRHLTASNHSYMYTSGTVRELAIWLAASNLDRTLLLRVHPTSDLSNDWIRGKRSPPTLIAAKKTVRRWEQSEGLPVH